MIISLSFVLGIKISPSRNKPTITVFKSGKRLVNSPISVSTIGQLSSIFTAKNLSLSSIKGIFSMAPGISNLRKTFFATSFSGEIITLTGNFSLVNKSW